MIRLGLTLPPRNRPTVSPAARNLRWLWIRSFCTPLPEIAHLRFRGQSRHRNRRSQCPLMDPQQGVQNPYFRVVPFIGGGRLSSSNRILSVSICKAYWDRGCRAVQIRSRRQSCCRIITNFQPQRIAGRYKGSRDILDGFRVKSLTGKKGGDRHDVLHA